MTIHRIFRVVASTAVSGDAVALDLEVQGAEPLGFTGGQYVILNTGVPLPGGKVAKRAYSLVSSDEVQNRCRILVKPVNNGPGSTMLMGAAVGTEIPFSGPWGKYRPLRTPDGSVVVLATDTGITAALGLCASERLKHHRARLSVVWLRSSPDYFVGDAYVAQELMGVQLSMVPLPPLGHPERLWVAKAALEAMGRAEVPTQVYLSGDGAIVHPLKDHLLERGPLSIDDVAVESFFNHPVRKAPSAGP